MTVTEQLSALDSILAHGDLHSLFQPIVSLSERYIFGYEALTRGPDVSPGPGLPICTTNELRQSSNIASHPLQA